MEDFDSPAGAITNARVVLFNGPPYSGKDTAAKYLVSLTPRSRHMKFSGTLKRSTHMDFGLPSDLPDDAFEKCKDKPHPAFFGMTPREAYIQKSEKRQKPFLGDDIYGRTALRRLWRAYKEGVRVFAFSDSGFADEAWPVVNAVGKENTLLICIHAYERGCDFSKDSRSYIFLSGTGIIDIDNNGTEDEFKGNLNRYVLPFVSYR